MPEAASREVIVAHLGYEPGGQRLPFRRPGRAPARLKSLKNFRQRAIYSERRAGQWVEPDKNISPTLAKLLP